MGAYPAGRPGKGNFQGEILLRLIVWHIRPKFQRKNRAAAMILCAGKALTEAG
jgi:hypothetical protein